MRFEIKNGGIRRNHCALIIFVKNQMGQLVSIPYDKLYEEWLTKRCELTMPINRIASNLGFINVKEGMDLDFSKLDKLAFYSVIYTEPWHHVALLLYRPHHPEMNTPTLEYIDSMATSRPGPQGYFEFRAFHEAKKHNIRFLGAEDMYGNIDEFTGNYRNEPPQNIENLLANNPNRSMVPSYRKSLEDYNQQEIPDEGRLQKYLESLVEYEGGDCTFWAHHIASQMVVNNISSPHWVFNFTTEVAQTPTMITQYVLQNMMYSLGQCTLRATPGT